MKTSAPKAENLVQNLFSQITDTISKIKPIDANLMLLAQNHIDNLTKPLGSLGRLESLAKQIVGITAQLKPKIKSKIIFTMAADHGVTEEKVSAYPKEVTEQMVYNFIRGGAGINVLARHIGAKVVVVDMGVARDLRPHPNLLIKKVNYGSQNMCKTTAMSKEEAIKSIAYGIEVFEEIYETEPLDIIGLGDMGIGNTTASSAIIACISGKNVEEVTGYGTGISQDNFLNKVEVIKRALAKHSPNPNDPWDILVKVGGFEIGGLCGLTLAAASRRVPVVCDGFITTAAALLAYKLCPMVKDYLIASHNSVEIGHQIMLETMGLKPLLNLDLRLGEGTGAALAINLIEASIKILNEMATFEQANVSQSL